MPISRIAVGNSSELSQVDALKAALAEFISMLIFVFAGEGSGMAFSKNFYLVIKICVGLNMHVVLTTIILQTIFKIIICIDTDTNTDTTRIRRYVSSLK